MKTSHNHTVNVNTRRKIIDDLSHPPLLLFAVGKGATWGGGEQQAGVAEGVDWGGAKRGGCPRRREAQKPGVHDVAPLPVESKGRPTKS
jgi:hypothetical protein